MTADPLQTTADRNLRCSRELASRLASTADDTAASMERMACLHEQIATQPFHPLHDQAATMARSERRFAAQEREAAAAFRRIANGASDDPEADGAGGR